MCGACGWCHILFHILLICGYHRYILRPRIFSKKVFKKMKTSFWSKNYSFFIIVSKFSTFKRFLSLAKKLYRQGERFFQGTKPFDMRSTSLLPPFGNVTKTQVPSLAKRIYFSQKTQISNVLRNSTSQPHQIWQSREPW